MCIISYNTIILLHLSTHFFGFPRFPVPGGGDIKYGLILPVMTDLRHS